MFQALVNGNLNSYLIQGLSASSEYEVLLSAIYGNEVESDELILVESTGKVENYFFLNVTCSISNSLLR